MLRSGSRHHCQCHHHHHHWPHHQRNLLQAASNLERPRGGRVTAVSLQLPRRPQQSVQFRDLPPFVHSIIQPGREHMALVWMDSVKSLNQTLKMNCSGTRWEVFAFCHRAAKWKGPPVSPSVFILKPRIVLKILYLLPGLSALAHSSTGGSQIRACGRLKYLVPTNFPAILTKICVSDAHHTNPQM